MAGLPVPEREPNEFPALLIPQLQMDPGKAPSDGERGLVTECRNRPAALGQTVVRDTGAEVMHVVVSYAGGEPP
jgi:hypothetical protein